jgi:hypothetical protein
MPDNAVVAFAYLLAYGAVAGYAIWLLRRYRRLSGRR